MTALDAAPRLKELAPHAKIILSTAHAELQSRTPAEPPVDPRLPKTDSTRLLPLAQRLTTQDVPPTARRRPIAHLRCTSVRLDAFSQRSRNHGSGCQGFVPFTGTPAIAAPTPGPHSLQVSRSPLILMALDCFLASISAIVMSWFQFPRGERVDGDQQ